MKDMPSGFPKQMGDPGYDWVFQTVSPSYRIDMIHCDRQVIRHPRSTLTIDRLSGTGQQLLYYPRERRLPIKTVVKVWAEVLTSITWPGPDLQ